MPESVCAPSLRRSDGALPGNGGMCCEGVASGSRPRPTAFKRPSLLLHSAVVSAFFFLLSLSFAFMQRSQLLQKSFSQEPRKLAFCHNSGENWTESTSVQTLSSSICGPNREISRKGLKVITLDKKGIYYGPRAADASTLSDFRGPWSLRWDRNFETLYMSISSFRCYHS